mmetsp:Transcript_20862/g.41605  ORF Transcript_20862/g.41605 Transcript_20862/m.41605 type:complete len:212 (-) Transcript_20862:816-1451(-)
MLSLPTAIPALGSCLAPLIPAVERIASLTAETTEDSRSEPPESAAAAIFSSPESMIRSTNREPLRKEMREMSAGKIPNALAVSRRTLASRRLRSTGSASTEAKFRLDARTERVTTFRGVSAAQVLSRENPHLCSRKATDHSVSMEDVGMDPESCATSCRNWPGRTSRRSSCAPARQQPFSSISSSHTISQLASQGHSLRKERERSPGVHSC